MRERETHTKNEGMFEMQNGRGYGMRLGIIPEPTKKAPPVVDMSIFQELRPDYSILDPAYEMLDQIEAVQLDDKQLKVIILADADMTIIMREVVSAKNVTHEFLTLRHDHRIVGGFTLVNKKHKYFHEGTGGMDSNDEANRFYSDFIERISKSKDK